MRPEGLSFRLDPIDKDDRPLTYAFAISIFGKAAWPVAGEEAITVEIQLDDLFAQLVEFWRPLLLRQTYPLGLTPLRPSLVSRDASYHWERKPQELIDDEAAILAAFEDAHDLSRAFGGVFDLPHFWMLREGDRMLCDTGWKLWRVPFEAVRQELSATGDWIAEHLMKTAPGKWDRTVEAWNRRDEIDQVDLVAWSASIDHEVAETLIETGAIRPPENFADAANDNDPLLIAARMAGELPTEQILLIIDIARSFGRHRAARLEKASAHCLEHMAQQSGSLPHSQGEAMAREARRYLRIDPSVSVDIFGLVEGLGVEIKAKVVEPPTFDGLAIAGGRYGPGAFINAGSQRLGKEVGNISANPGARITLAHELCHLLLDREHPLSAVEVLRSRMPASVEARAKAFAGEFLLPTAAAADRWYRAGSPTDSEKLVPVLQDLADDFGVSFSVAAWKLEHGSGSIRQRLRPVLDTLAPYR